MVDHAAERPLARLLELRSSIQDGVKIGLIHIVVLSARHSLRVIRYLHVKIHQARTQFQSMYRYLKARKLQKKSIHKYNV